MADTLVAEISRRALEANLDLLRTTIGPGVRLVPVVKANAYGHGLEAVLPILEPKVDGVAVATYREASSLRRLGYRGAVLVFLPPASADLDASATAALVATDTTFTVTSAADARMLAEQAMGAAPAVHLKIDTGLNRSGARAEEAGELLRALRRDEGLRLTGVYTHFAAAEEADRSFVRQQLARFLAAVETGGGRDGLELHAANSAALLVAPETHLDLVRPGLAVYGYSPFFPHGGPAVAAELEPALRLTAPIVHAKPIRAGETSGYGRTFTAKRDGRLGLVPVGYADGYPWALGNGAFVGVRGRLAPICGRVSMDQIVIDLTEIDGAGVGDEVEIISPDRSRPHGLEALARAAGTISYDLAVGLGARVERRAVTDFSV